MFYLLQDGRNLFLVKAAGPCRYHQDSLLREAISCCGKQPRFRLPLNCLWCELFARRSGAETDTPIGDVTTEGLNDAWLGNVLI